MRIKKVLLASLVLLVIILGLAYSSGDFDDDDNDGVPNELDKCPDSLKGEDIDRNGCDAFQFCEQFSCSLNCFSADFKNNENTTMPGDCTVVIIAKEGKYYPRCT